MNQKIIKTIALFSLLLSLFMGGCALFGPEQTKEEVLEAFFDDIRGQNWTNMYKHIHPDNSNRNAYKSGSAFSTAFEGGGSAVSYSIVSKNGDTFSVSVDYPSSPPATETYKFKIDDEVGINYYTIISFEATGSTY